MIRINQIKKQNEDMNLKSIKNNGPEVIFEDSNFKFVTYTNTDVYDYTYQSYKVNTKDNSKAEEFVIEIRIDKRWKTWEPTGVEITYGLSSQGRGSITEFIKTLQDSIKFAEKVAAYLKVKVVNK